MTTRRAGQPRHPFRRRDGDGTRHGRCADPQPIEPELVVQQPFGRRAFLADRQASLLTPAVELLLLSRR